MPAIFITAIFLGSYEMTSTENSKGKYSSPLFDKVTLPLHEILRSTPILESRGNRPLQMEFKDQLNALVLFHLNGYESARELIQVLKEDDFARNNIAPEKGISRSSFSEAINTRGLDQFLYVFQELRKKACSILPKNYSDLGDLVAIDGSFIDSVLSMVWADFRGNSKKAKLHLGFNINQGIPHKLYLTDGKGNERPFVDIILAPGQTGVLDRGYQCHKNFDTLQEMNKHFVCRIKANTHKECIEKFITNPDSIVFYDARVLLGKTELSRTKKELRVVGYKINGTKFWVATDRFDLSADKIALIYKLRWDIEIFFGWWKRHLKVYHLIARSKEGLHIQILSGLITYLLLAIYCREQYAEPVSIKRVRELRIKIQNELREIDNANKEVLDENSQSLTYASP